MPGALIRKQITQTERVTDDVMKLPDWNKLQEILVSTAKEKVWQTRGKGAYNEKESLWLNEDTRRAITAKEEAFKAYQKDKSEEQH